MRSNATTLMALCCLLPFFGIDLISQNPGFGPHPYAINGLSVSLDNEGTAMICAEDLIPDYYSRCEIEEARISKNFGSLNDASSILDLDCDDIGTLLVSVWVRNAGDNWNYTDTYVIVQDPQGICIGGVGSADFPAKAINGLIVSLDENLTATVHARDFVVACVDEDARFAFSADPADSLLTVTCDDEGTAIVEIWTIDASNVVNYTDTYLLVNDALSACGGSPGTCVPPVLLINGLTFNLPTTGVFHLKADDFVQPSLVAPDCAWQGSVTYSFSADTDDQWLSIDCDDIGTFVVTIYATDQMGTQSYNETYLLIQDNFDHCEMLPVEPPANDSICQAIALDAYMDGCPISFSNLSATAETDEPAPEQGACTANGFWCDPIVDASIWYTFTAPATGNVIIKTNIFNTQIAVWEADNCADLTQGNALLVDASDDIPGGNGQGSALNLHCLIPGETYYLQIDGFQGAQDQAFLSIEDGGDACQISELSYSCEGTISVALLNGTGSWKTFNSSDGGYLGAANDNGNYIGIVEMSANTHTSSIRTDIVGTPYLDRNWAFNPESDAVAPFNLRLYITQEEFFALASANNMINTLEDLHLTRVPEGSCSDYNAAGELYEQVGSGVQDMATNTLYVEFIIPGFSAFYLHGPEPLVFSDTEELQAGQLRVQPFIPNPTKGITTFALEVPSAEDVEITLRQLDGQIISSRTQTLLEGSHQIELDLGELPNGVYLVRVATPGGQKTMRLVKTE